MNWPRLDPDATYRKSGWHIEALRHGARKTCSRGEYIYHYGDPATNVMLVIRGFVARACGDDFVRDRGEILIDIHGEGELIGIPAALPDAKNYPDSARVHSKQAGVIVFPAAFVRGRDTQQPSVVRSLLQEHVQKCIATALLSEPGWKTSMKFAPTLDKMKMLLLELAERFGRIDSSVAGGVIIDISLSQQDLGELVGLSREHVSRVCAALKRQGLLKVEKFTIVIPDLKKLQAA